VRGFSVETSSSNQPTISEPATLRNMYR
jgi:hypothetical protein